jgi:hypothetical protein
MHGKLTIEKFGARLVGAFLGYLLAVGIAPVLRGASDDATAPTVNSPQPGDLMITGTASAGAKILVTRTHKDGSIDELVTTADGSGNFSIDLGTHEPLAAGDSVTAATIATMLPKLTKIAGTPSVITFASSFAQSTGTISFVLAYSGNYGWPAGVLGPHTGEVTGDTIKLDEKEALNIPQDATVTDLTAVETAVTSPPITVKTPLCDWGRVRCYAYFGGAFSGDFSKQDPYLDFDTETYIVKRREKSHASPILATFFDVRLTQIPTTSTSSTAASSAPATSQSNNSSGGGSGSGRQSTDSATQAATAFSTAARSIQIQGGVYWAPYVPKYLTWNYQKNDYGFIPSLLFKSGGRGSVDGVVSQDQLAFPGQDKSFFTYWGGGFRLSFVQRHRPRGEAHETLSYVDFTFGKDRLYDFVGPDFGGATGGGLSNVRHYGMRKMVEARMKIPKVDLYLGTDLNLGQGQNEVRLVVMTNAISILKSLVGVQ